MIGYYQPAQMSEATAITVTGTAATSLTVELVCYPYYGPEEMEEEAVPRQRARAPRRGELPEPCPLRPLAGRATPPWPARLRRFRCARRV